MKSKKIGILTYYGVHNHGAVLQAFALQRVLENLGHDVRLLSFERSYEYISEEKKKKYKLGIGSISYYLKYLHKNGLRAVLYNYKKNRILTAFRKTRFNIDTSYDSFEGDLVVVGSDEVFSLEIGYNPMMYGYGLKTANIISYAGSFGPTTISEISGKNKRTEIEQGLSKFSNIGVRDQNSKEIIGELLEKDVPIVCDPVILYGYTEEMNNMEMRSPGYILVYAYDNRMNEPEEVEFIRNYAREHGLGIYSVGYYHKWCDKCINAAPLDLLVWFKNADLVITDTFHGTVFSVIGNVPFICKISNNSNKLSYLLDEYGLLNRRIESFSEMNKVIKSKIDYSDVNKRIYNNRKESMEFITSVLTN